MYYNLINRKNKALEALSGIDVQLKMRSDLIPNILTIAQKFMDHEKSLITEVTELRTRLAKDYDKTNPAEVSDHLKMAEALSSSMGKLMVAVEAYPDLKSDETMLNAQRTYSEVESRISAARRFYNSAVTQLNNSVEIFPSSVIARYVGVSAMPFYEAEEAAKAPVNASDFLR
jgi:LemA protein